MVMGQAFEFDGMRYDTEGEFLDAVAHAYKSGDEQTALDALEDYGYSLSDIQVRTAA